MRNLDREANGRDRALRLDKQVLLAEVAEYVTESGNPGNTRIFSAEGNADRAANAFADLLGVEATFMS